MAISRVSFCSENQIGEQLGAQGEREYSEERREGTIPADSINGSSKGVALIAHPNEISPDHLKGKIEPNSCLWRKAIYNQVFVLYANRPGPFFSGHSAVFDPQGEIIVKTGSEETVVEADVDMSKVQKWRKEEQIYPYRRPLLYREILNRPKRDYMALAKENQAQRLAKAS